MRMLHRPVSVLGGVVCCYMVVMVPRYCRQLRIAKEGVSHGGLGLLCIDLLDNIDYRDENCVPEAVCDKLATPTVCT